MGANSNAHYAGGALRRAVRVGAVLAMLLLSAGPSATPAAADAPIQITDQLTLQVRHVPVRVKVGEPFTVELVFHNRSDQPIVASRPPVAGGLVEFTTVEYSPPCPPAAIWSGWTSGGDPSLQLVDAGSSCGGRHAYLSIGGTVPVRSQATFTLTGTPSQPGVLRFSVSGQAFEIQFV
jgi:hypothetical protein